MRWNCGAACAETPPAFYRANIQSAPERRPAGDSARAQLLFDGRNWLFNVPREISAPASAVIVPSMSRMTV